MAYHQYDYGSRYTTNECDSLEVRFSSLESKISDLTDLVKVIASRNTPSMGRFGTNSQYVNPMDEPPTFHYITEPDYTYGEFSCPDQNPFYSYSNTYYPGWQHHSNPNEYEYEWQENSFSSYEATSPTTNYTFENSGMSLEGMVQLIALNTTFYSFQQETMAQIQDLTNQINEYISSQNRWEAKEEETRLVDELKLQAAIKEEDDEVTASYSFSGSKGDDVVKQRPMVVPPPYLESIIDKIKVEEELVDNRETFTMLDEPMVDGMKGTPGDGVFAYLQKELLKICKGTVLEIRMDFKAPQHVEKMHVWGIDLLDTG